MQRFRWDIFADPYIRGGTSCPRGSPGFGENGKCMYRLPDPSPMPHLYDSDVHVIWLRDGILSRDGDWQHSQGSI